MNLVVLTPHFEPDVAPTGTLVARLVHELAGRGHRFQVITALPWYRTHHVEPGYEGRLVRREDTPWGEIVRVHPFPAPDKQNLVRRGLAYAGFSALAAAAGVRGPQADCVLAISPPLTLGLSGLAVSRARRAPLVFNVQDVYPDVAVELGVLKGPRVIAATARLERFVYAHSAAVTVLSDDLHDNVAAKVADAAKVRIIPNFVDTDWITPAERENSYRREHGLEGKVVAMYAGNVGMSQALDLVLHAAEALAHEPDLVFVVNGQGAARAALERRASGMTNVRFVDMQPRERVPELLNAADIHLVPLKRGLARSSVPVKTYSILAAGRPLVASVDEGSEVARIVTEAGAGIAVPPEDPESFTKAIVRLVHDEEAARSMGAAGRRFVEGWASPASVADAYENLFRAVAADKARR